MPHAILRRHFAVLPHPLGDESLKRPQWLVPRPQVGGMREHLHDAEVLQLMDRLRHDIGARELHIGIDPGDVFPVVRQAGNADIDQVFLVPDFVVGAQANVPWVGGLGDREVTVAIRGFDRVKNSPGIGDVFLEIAIQCVAGTETGWIDNGTDDIKRRVNRLNGQRGHGLVYHLSNIRMNPVIRK
jgi:hypothetical protein